MPIKVDQDAYRESARACAESMHGIIKPHTFTSQEHFGWLASDSSPWAIKRKPSQHCWTMQTIIADIHLAEAHDHQIDFT